MTLIVITLKVTVMIPELINAMIIELRYREEIDLDANLSGQEDAASTEFSRLILVSERVLRPH